ncbi:MAG: S8 family peptidase [Chitinophagales bacterium]|nr:S8 family peptidase [Chitinophagales bacterium]
MKETFITLIVLMLLNIVSYAQEKVEIRARGANYLHLLDIIKTDENRSQTIRKWFPVLENQNQEECVRLLLMTDASFDEKALLQIGGAINSRVENNISIILPVQQIPLLESLEGIRYIEADYFLEMHLDSAKISTRTDLVHQALCSPIAYKGQDVVIGIIDLGFDYSHPAFLSEDGSRFRIKRVWNQRITSGMPPDNFSYGVALSDSIAIITHQLDSVFSIPHGSMVAGCATGSGFGLSPHYGGIAPEADIVIVSVGGLAPPGSISIIDGIQYVFDYAQNVGKPAVINISLGSTTGAHDGTGYINQLLDDLAGSGQIIINSAGNSGDDPIHIKHTFNNDTISTLAIMPFDRTSQIDIWGETNHNFQVKLEILDLNTNIVADTGFIDCSDGYFTYTTSPYASATISKRTHDFFNQKPNFRIWLDSIQSDHYIKLSVTAGSGTVHIWNNNGLFDSQTPYSPPLDNIVIGDNEYTINDMATTHNVLSAGAYVTREYYNDLQGSTQTEGQLKQDIADFSSRGPTVDGRIKPDITAPGSIIITPSGQDFFFSHTGNNSPYATTKQSHLGKEYFYSAVQGTSFSAPITTGIIALMLQIDPGLTVNDIRNIWQNTAMSDSHTGSVPNNTWGRGKIDACSIIQQMLGVANVDETKPEKRFILYPNPAVELLFVQMLEVSEMHKLAIIDLNGSVISETLNPTSITEIDIGFLPKGVYVVRIIEKNGNILSSKFIKT